MDYFNFEQFITDEEGIAFQEYNDHQQQDLMDLFDPVRVSEPSNSSIIDDIEIQSLSPASENRDIIGDLNTNSYEEINAEQQQELLDILRDSDDQTMERTNKRPASPCDTTSERARGAQIGYGDDEDAFQLQLKSKKKFGNTASMNTFGLNIAENLKLSYNKMNDQIEKIFDKAIKEVGDECGVDFTRGKIVLHTKDLEPIIIPLQPYKDLSGKLVMTTVNDVLQSHQEVELDCDEFEITISAISIPGGSGVNMPYNSPDCAYSKSSVCEVVDSSVTCLAQAIAIGFAKSSVVENMPKCGRGQQNKVLLESGRCSQSHYSTIRMKSRNERLDLAKIMCTRVGVSTKGCLSIEDIGKFEVLLHRNIVAVSTEYANQVVYPGCGRYEKMLFVLHTLNKEGGGHFHTISDICKFYGKGCFCFDCLKPFNKENPVCFHYCHLCTGFNCEAGEPIDCPNCHFTFKSVKCFEKHLQTPPKEKYKGKNKDMDEDLRQSRCDKIKKCPDCNAYLIQSKRSLKDHVCFEKYCRYCKQFTTEENHLCYQRCVDIEEKGQKLMFYDVETSVSEQIVECKGGYKPDPATKKCLNCNKLHCGQSKHVAVTIVCETACDICKDKEVTDASRCTNCGCRCFGCETKKKGKFITQPCPETCGLRRKIFYGKHCLWEFYSFLMKEYHSGLTLLAHGGSRFDSHLLLSMAIEQGGTPTNICFKGTKMIFMNLAHNITCIDSYSFLPFALSKFKTNLGLEVECEKYDFPYSFIKYANLDYVGPWPSLDQYNTNRYESEEEKKEFVTWHETQATETFDFKEEIVKYCVQDVVILRKGALKFQDLIYDLTVEKDEEGEIVKPGILAFTKPTMASLAMHVYRTKFHWENHQVSNELGEVVNARYQGGHYYGEDESGNWERITPPSFLNFLDSPIAACPNDNYLQKDNFSQVSIKWLMWKQKQLGVPIQTALSPEGEMRVPISAKVVYRLDGYVKPEDNNGKPLALEYCGCHYHGHSSSNNCTDKAVKYSPAWQSANTLYEKTLYKVKDLESHGYEVQLIWGCEYNKMLKENGEMKTFVDNVKVAPRLNIRDGIYGGRVSPVSLLAESEGCSKIHFADICSLYPSRMRDEAFMVGHPQILRDVAPSKVPDLFGYVYCKVLPPQDLFFPLLPTRIDGKLLFVLCQTCGSNKQTEKCEHSDEERSIEGVYTTPELHKAIQLGYEITDVHEAWHWEQTTKYVKGKKFTGLFGEYVNLFLKVKTESSGWPSGVETEEQKDAYIQAYYEREGIKLDKEKIVYNAALRGIAKLLLNSQFGKYIQKPNAGSTHFFYKDDIAKLHEILLDPMTKVTDFHILSDKTIMIETKTSQSSQSESEFTNPAIGGFITSYGRIKLYETLELLQDKVLYYDTDSAMFLGGDNIEDSVPIAPYLGELENELKGDDYVESFVSLGCKSYAYTSKKGKKVVKVKGFTLKAQPTINIDSMRELLLNEQEERLGCTVQPKKKHITIEQFNIRRVKEQQALYNTTETKSFKLTFDKRVLNWNNFSSLPYGYI